MHKFTTKKPITKNTAIHEPQQEYSEKLEEAVIVGDLWYEKYRPKEINDIMLSSAKIKTVMQWFEDFNNHKVEKKALLFSGPPGLGKTSLAHLILNHIGYQIKEFNASDIRSQSLVNKNMYDIVCISDVIQSAAPIAIIMDEVDGMLTGDRGGIDELLSFIQPNKTRKTRKKPVKNKKRKTNVWGPPIICICNTGNIKSNTISDLRKHCVEIAFTKPSVADLQKIIDKISKAENFEIDPAACKEVIHYSQGDFRRLICILQHLFSRYGEIVTKDNVISSYQIFCQKEQDLHVKDNIKRILNKQLDFHTVMNVYRRDKSKAPMVMHQNYIKAIEIQKTVPFNKIDNAISTIESLVDSDIIEKTMYNTQGWHLQQIQGLTCCCIPCYYINKSPKLQSVEASWTEVLGTSSHTQTSKKKIQEILYRMNKRNSYNTLDIQFLAEMVIYLFTNGRETEGTELLKSYGLCESKIIDKLSSIIKLNSGSSVWKTKASSEKTKIDNIITQHNKIEEDGVIKLQTQKITRLSPTTISKEPVKKSPIITIRTPPTKTSPPGTPTSPSGTPKISINIPEIVVSRRSRRKLVRK